MKVWIITAQHENGPGSSWSRYVAQVYSGTEPEKRMHDLARPLWEKMGDGRGGRTTWTFEQYLRAFHWSYGYEHEVKT